MLFSFFNFSKIYFILSFNGDAIHLKPRVNSIILNIAILKIVNGKEYENLREKRKIYI